MLLHDLEVHHEPRDNVLPEWPSRLDSASNVAVSDSRAFSSLLSWKKIQRQVHSHDGNTLHNRNYILHTCLGDPAGINMASP